MILLWRMVSVTVKINFKITAERILFANVKKRNDDNNLEGAETLEFYRRLISKYDDFFLSVMPALRQSKNWHLCLFHSICCCCCCAQVESVSIKVTACRELCTWSRGWGRESPCRWSQLGHPRSNKICFLFTWKDFGLIWLINKPNLAKF